MFLPLLRPNPTAALIADNAWEQHSDGVSVRRKKRPTQRPWGEEEVVTSADEDLGGGRANVG